MSQCKAPCTSDRTSPNMHMFYSHCLCQFSSPSASPSCLAHTPVPLAFRILLQVGACGSVAPSRLEAGFACYDHFLAAATRSGEPLGYRGAALKVRARCQLQRPLLCLRFLKGRLQAAVQYAARVSVSRAGQPADVVAAACPRAARRRAGCLAAGARPGVLQGLRRREPGDQAANTMLQAM